MARTEQLVSGGITLYGTLVVVLLLVLLYAAYSSAAEYDGVEDGSLAIRFVPIQAKAKQLVAVELVRPAHPGERYKILERVVFKNDWRPALFTMSDQYNPGRCKVELIEDGYDIDCTLNHVSGVPFVQREQVKTVEEVIIIIKEFSKKRTTPAPKPLKKERGPISTKLV